MASLLSTPYLVSSFSLSFSHVTLHTHTLIPSNTCSLSFLSVSTRQRRAYFSVPTLSRSSSVNHQTSSGDMIFRPDGLESMRCRLNHSESNPEAETEMLPPFFRQMGLDEEQIHLLYINNPTLVSAPVDGVRKRVFSLQSLGINGIDLCNLLLKCPFLLTAKEVDPFVRFVTEELEGQFDPLQFKRLMSVVPTVFLTGFDEKVAVLLNHGVPSDKIAHVLNKVSLAKAFCHRSVKEIDRILTFLNRFGGISLIVKHPTILNYDLDTQLVPRIRYLTKLSGGDEAAVGTVLRRLPAYLKYSVEHVKGHVELLRSSAGLSNEQIFRILLAFPNVLSASRERKLRPRIEFLKQCELSSSDIFKFLIKAPVFLAYSFEDNIVHKLVLLVKIGFKSRTKDLAMGMRSVSRTSCKNLQKVIGLFLNYGLSCEEILSMSQKHPQILQYNPSSLEEKIEYLIEVMGRDIEDLLAFPSFLGYKLNDRIKARYEAIQSTSRERISINTLLTVSTEEFIGKKQCVEST